MNVPDWIDRDEYPFESNYLSLDMGRMHYVDEGKGEPVVMVHGNPTWSFLYRDLIKRLSKHYRCVAVDHIGFGLSDTPESWSYLPEDHAQNLSTFIDALGLKDITLVVQDWGGPIGLSYAIHHPQNVKRLVIMNTWMWPAHDDRGKSVFSQLLGGPVGRFLILRFNFFANVVMPQSFGDKSRLTPHIHQHYLRPLDRPEKRKGCWVFPRQILGSSKWLGTLWTDRQKLTRKPALFLWGMKDPAFQEHDLKRWIELFPNAAVKRFETAGHYVQEEGGEVLCRTVEDFLAREDHVTPIN